MTVFRTPSLTDLDNAVIGLISELRLEMSGRLGEPRRWRGGLRRMTEARAVQASNSIEGYIASLDDVLAVTDSDEPVDADRETWLAVEGYQEAMTYVLQAAQDGEIRVDEGLLKVLHFMMLKHELSKGPGRWRPGEIRVVRTGSGDVVHEAPDAHLVPALITAMLEEIRGESPVLVRAAMAHLNLVMIRPFRDGNGRMARCLQTLILAKERIVAPVFSSIEEYLGRNTDAYYAVLAEVGEGSWHPEKSATPWIRFCLTAHYRQALVMLRRMQAYEEMWTVASRMVEERRLPERAAGPLVDAAYGLRIKRSNYLRSVEVTHGDPISELTASRDLRALVGAGLLEPFGDTRGRYYLGAPQLKGAWDEIRAKWPRGIGSEDPFEIVGGRLQLSLELPAG
jgi:Fic family protein